MRIDPNFSEKDMLNAGESFLNEGLVHLANRWSMWNAPRDVYRIDLTKAENKDTLFMSLDRQARKAVRKSRKQEVTIQHATLLSDFNIFCKIFKEFTSERGFMSRGYAYQKALWDEFVMPDNGKLFLAIYQGKIIGGLLCLVFGKKCLAMHMGTLLKHRHLRTNDAYVWEAIKWAKGISCSWFSFRGVGSSQTEKRFKKKFGPNEVALVGYYDLPFHPLLYSLFCKIEFELIPMAVPIFITIRKTGRILANRVFPNKLS